MSIEAALAEFTAALKENTAAVRARARGSEADAGVIVMTAPVQSAPDPGGYIVPVLDPAEVSKTGAEVTIRHLEGLHRTFMRGRGRGADYFWRRVEKMRAAMEHLRAHSLYHLRDGTDRLKLYAYLICWTSGTGDFDFAFVDQRLQDGWTVAAICDEILEEHGGPEPERVAEGTHSDPPGPDIAIAPYYQAMLRHLSGWWDGEHTGVGTRIHHLGHVVACCAILIDAEFGNLLIDDRDAASPELKRLLAAFPAPRSGEEAYVDQVHMDLSEEWLDHGCFYVSADDQLQPTW
jgi:hypothetical protein